MITFSKDDTYKVTNIKKDEKLVVDYKVLVRLYQPLIGSNALSVYLTLESEYTLNRRSRVHYPINRLIKLLQIDEASFNDAIEKLKGLNLVTYKGNSKKANDYAFFLNQAKTANEFLSDESLSESLKVIVSEEYFKQMVNYFTTEEEFSDYVDIDEISLAKEPSNEEFYDFLFEKYPVLQSVTNFNDKTKKEIERLKNLFKLDYSKIENALLNSIQYDQNGMFIDLNKLNDFISEKYSLLNNDKLSEDEKLAKQFEGKSLLYLMKISKRDSLFPYETADIEYLLDTYKIKDEVLNVAINIYYRNNNTTSNRVNKIYLGKVIEDMLANGVTDAVGAMNYFRNKNKKKQTERVEVTKETKYEVKTNTNNEVNEEVSEDTLATLKALMGG